MPGIRPATRAASRAQRRRPTLRLPSRPQSGRSSRTGRPAQPTPASDALASARRLANSRSPPHDVRRRRLAPPSPDSDARIDCAEKRATTGARVVAAAAEPPAEPPPDRATAASPDATAAAQRRRPNRPHAPCRADAPDRSPLTAAAADRRAARVAGTAGDDTWGERAPPQWRADSRGSPTRERTRVAAARHLRP